MKYNFRIILERLKFWEKQSRKWDKAFDDLTKTIAPSSYPPIIDDNFIQAFIEGVAHNNKELETDLLDYIYEPTLVITMKDDKKYNLKIKKQAIEYFNLIYNKK